MGQPDGSRAYCCPALFIYCCFRLYFELINYSTIGFGDLVPEDEMTVAGAILKNVLVKIPAALLLLTLYIRLLPVIAWAKV